VEDSQVHVLIASQDALLRRAATGLLQGLGHETVTAGSGTEAWHILNSDHPPSLALLECNLPGIDAPALCARLRDRENAPFVYLIVIGSGNAAVEPLAALNAGADDHLARPLNHCTLKLRLRAAERIVALQDDFRESRQALEYKSTHDALTGTWNRAEVLGILEREVARSRREGWQVSVIMVDVDLFKNINDTYGHLMGDAALREITARLLVSLRPYDVLGRYGGEEFLVVLGGCSPRNAQTLAERLREQVAAQPVAVADEEVTVTISAGVAAWNPNECGDIQALLRAADVALYEAKRNGRNRVRTAWETRPAADSAADAA
jgi:two-component system cell cycle response regulator